MKTVITVLCYIVIVLAILFCIVGAIKVMGLSQKAYGAMTAFLIFLTLGHGAMGVLYLVNKKKDGNGL
jgi:hypothetical protein